MGDAPLVSIVDPRDRGQGGDVLQSGDERGPRWSRRARVLAGTLAAAGVLAAVAVPRVLAAREEQRAADAAFAVADTVHLRVTAQAVVGADRQLSAIYLLDDDGTPSYADRLVRARLEGAGLRPVDPGARPVYESVPVELFASAAVDCRAVTAGAYPDAALVTTALPLSKVEHVERLPLAPDQVREAALQACDLPDPDARPLVEVQGTAKGELFLNLETVARSKDELALDDVRLPGFTVTPVDGLDLPRVLGVNSGGIYGFRLAVADCAVARSSRDVRVSIRVGGVRETRVADTRTSQPQPGGEPIGALLDRLVERAC